MSEPQKYRKKPVVIEAMVLDGHTVDVARWLTENGAAFCADTHPTDAAQDVLHIETLEGTMRAEPGDYVICGVAGEFYPCEPSIFAATYEPAETPTSRTIPWPPSDEMVERVASMLEATDGGDYDAMARAVLDAIGGEA